MKNVKFLMGGILICVFFVGVSCHQGKVNAQKSGKKENIQVSLFDKSLPEIQKYINGEWKLVSGKNGREVCEYEGTFIKFNGDKYIWTEDGKAEPGDMNWRKAETGNGYESYLMDVFYAEHPAYPLSLNGDTLFIQDCSETAYRYTLIRK